MTFAIENVVLLIRSKSNLKIHPKFQKEAEKKADINQTKTRCMEMRGKNAEEDGNIKFKTK